MTQERGQKITTIVCASALVLSALALLMQMEVIPAPMPIKSHIRLSWIPVNYYPEITANAERLTVTDQWGKDSVGFYDYYGSERGVIDLITVCGDDVPMGCESFTATDVPDEEWTAWTTRYSEKRPMVAWSPNHSKPDPRYTTECVWLWL